MRFFKQYNYLIVLTAITILSAFIIFWKLGTPKQTIWDETYHIASAQKYLNKVYFMELHPPLGKILIAMGEFLIDASRTDDSFIHRDNMGKIPDGFDYFGYRFLPAFFGFLLAPLIFLLLRLITESNWFAALGAAGVLFDNALVLHSRAALLESFLLFFIFLSIYLFFIIINKDKDSFVFNTNYLIFILFGVSTALSSLVKSTGIVVILLALFLPFYFTCKRFGYLKIFAYCANFTIGIVLTIIVVWGTHFYLGKKVINNKYYAASQEYKNILDHKKDYGIVKNFWYQIRDSYIYSYNYNDGVPKLDLCKAGETGSPWYMWPLGGRTINYTWFTPDGNIYHYIYLVGNPLVWLLSLTGVIFALAWVLTDLFFDIKLKNKFPIYTFSILYISYLIPFMIIKRVMYLYHYFPALIFGYILFVLVLIEIEHFLNVKIKYKHKKIGIIIIVFFIISCFYFYKPLTYFEPLNNKEFDRRNIMSVWDLRPVKLN